MCPATTGCRESRRKEYFELMLVHFLVAAPLILHFPQKSFVALVQFEPAHLHDIVLQLEVLDVVGVVGLYISGADVGVELLSDQCLFVGIGDQ